MALVISPRTAPGKAGKPIKVKVNAFECKLPTTCVQHHSVDFGGGLSRELRITIIKYLVATNQLFQGAKPVPFAFDGKANLYMLSGSPMPNKEYVVNEDIVKKITTAAGKTPRMLTITIKHAALVPVASLIDLVASRCTFQDDKQTNPAIAAFNIIMKMAPIYDNGYSFKRNNFYIPKENVAEFKLLEEMFKPQPVKNSLQGGVDLFGGYVSSIRPGLGKMILNVNRTSAPMLRGNANLVEILMEYLNVRDINRANPLNPQMPNDYRFKILRFLKGLYVKVRTRNPRDKFNIKNVEKKSAKTFTFQSEYGMINVQDYFKKKHNMTLKYPDLPVVQITKNAFYPMECCEIWFAGNFVKKLSAAQTSEMLKSRFVTLSPAIKRHAINIGLQQLQINSAFHQSWNIQVNPNMMEVGGRQLQAPQLQYRNAKGQPQTVNTNDGSWMTKGLKAWRSGLKVNRWIVVVFAGDHAGRPPSWDGMPLAQVQDAVTGLVTGCKELGMQFAVERPTIYHAGNVQNVREQFVSASKKAGYGPQNPPELVVTFSNGSTQYDQIKRVCDVELGVVSQNLQIGKADSSKGVYWINVAMKVNAKLRGVNQVTASPLPGLNVPTMLMGADVTHPGKGTCMPSIAALVASIDKSGVEFGSEHNIQDGTEEIIQDLGHMLKKRLNAFYAANKTKPQRLIFWRDGISEGQFAESAQKEITIIKETCNDLEAGYKPSLTFIVCAKRHHLQFFPASDKEADRSGNSRAGTIVDTEVTHPSFDDWYLLSHGGLLGTSKPTHYTVLLDECKLGKDAIQNLTFQTAFLMPRSTKSISIAAPAQYAHIICDRVRKWIGPMEADFDRMTAQGMPEPEKKEALLKIARERPHVLHQNLHANMFYM